MTLDDVRRNRNLLFWGLHTLGWSAYLITQYMGALLYEKPASYIKVILVAAASGFLLSAAVIHLTRCVAMQLGEQGVRVDSISPGGIATGMFGKAAGLIDDVAQVAAFLASDDSTFVNGHDLVVDGGLIGGQRWSQNQERLQAMRAAFRAQQV